MSEVSTSSDSTPANASTSTSDSTSTDDKLSSLQKQGESYVPSGAVIERSWTPDLDALHARSIADPQAFWAEQAQQLEWFTPWNEVLQWQESPPTVKWFTGAQCNITVNALDRHVRNGRRNKVALIWAGEPGEALVKERILTYGQLLRRVNQCANALKRMGVHQGDRVTIYMALTPELPIAMLACARIGAIHTVVYGGFSAPALRSRIEDSESKAVICTDIGYRRGRRIDLKAAVDEAVRGLTSVKAVMVYRRGHTPLELNPDLEVDFDKSLDAESDVC